MSSPGGAIDAAHHPRQWEPTAARGARRSVDFGAYRGRRPALRLRARCAAACRRRRVDRGGAARTLSDPPAQRSHHRSQRHLHFAMDHVVPTPTAPRLRSRRHGVAPAGDRGDARTRHRLPHGAPRRPGVAADRRGGRMRTGRRAGGRRGPGHRRAHRSRPGPPDRGLPGRGGRAVRGHRGRHGPVRRAGRASVRERTCWCTR